MMLPLTSLVPSVIELVSFIENNWPHIWWFPNWYLGVPLRFVTGPVVPLVVIVFQKLTGVSFQSVYLGLIVVAWLVGGIGMSLLVKVLGGGKRSQRLASILFLFLPFHLLLLTYGNGLGHIVTALLPWVFWSWWHVLGSTNRTWGFLTIGLVSVALLIDTSVLLPIVVGVIALICLLERKGWVKGVMKSLLILAISLFLSTIWYTPKFWWVILGNPSFAGKPLSNVIPYVLQLVQVLVPLIAGAWVVQKRYRLTNKVIRFGVLFGISFLFLTLIRFLSDIDFWMDWSGYFLELQLAFALSGGLLFSRYTKRQFISILVISILTISNGLLFFRFYKTDPRSLTYKNSIIEHVTKHKEPGERIFLSGTPVFWLSQSLDHPLMQVRGGRDQVATHQTWGIGAYQIREGEEALLSRLWLSVFGVSKVLVHKKESQEFFDDFKRLDKFESLPSIASWEGNSLYATTGHIARLAKKDIMHIDRLKSGSDQMVLENYMQTLGESLDIRSTSFDDFRIVSSEDVLKGHVISLAVTHDPAWQVVSGNADLRSDVLGQMLIVPKSSESSFQLSYKASWWGSVVSGVCALALMVFLFLFEKVYPRFEKKYPSIRPDFQDEEYTY